MILLLSSLSAVKPSLVVGTVEFHGFSKSGISYAVHELLISLTKAVVPGYQNVQNTDPRFQLLTQKLVTMRGKRQYFSQEQQTSRELLKYLRLRFPPTAFQVAW